MPEGGAGEIVAAQDEGWAMGGAVGVVDVVLHATGFNSVGIGELDIFGEVEGPAHESGVEVIDVAVVSVETSLTGLFVRGGLAERDVAGGPEFLVFGGGLRDLAWIDLVGLVGVDDPVGPDRGGEGTHGGVDAGDPGDEEVGVGEVEAGVEAKGHDRGGGAGSGYSCEEAEDSGLGIEVEVVVAGGEGEDGVEVLALDPELVLAGDVAGVFALFEHADDDYLDFDGLLRLGQDGSAGERGEQKESWESAHV